MKRKIELMHVLYWAVIFISIQVLVYALVGNSDLVDKLSFAGTLISILVGVLALSIALYQGLTQSSSLEKMEDASDRIQAVTSSLEDAKVAELYNNIKQLFVEADFKGLRQEVSTTLNRNVPIQTSNNGDLELSKEVIKLIYLEAEFELRLAYILFKSFKHNQEVNFLDINEYIVDRESQSKDSMQNAFYMVEQYTVFNIALGRFTSLRGFKYETIEEDLFIIKVVEMDEIILNAISERVDGNSDFKPVKTIIDRYFI